MPYRRAMRLILDAEIRPETRRASARACPASRSSTSATTTAFDAGGPRRSGGRDPRRPARPPADLARVPALRWLQVRSAGVDHLAADPPWRKGLLVTNARGVYAVPIGEYVSGMVLRVHQPAATWSADQAAHRWPPSRPSLVVDRPRPDRGHRRLRLDRSRGRSPAVRARDADHRGQATRPEVRARHGVPGPGHGRPRRLDPRPDRGRRRPRRGRARGGRPGRDDAAHGRVARDRRARGRRRACPGTPGSINVSRGALVDEPALLEALQRRPARRGRPRRLRPRSRCRPTARGGTPRTSS